MTMIIHGLPQQEFIEKITTGFPAEIVWALEKLAGESSSEFELVGLAGHNLRVFHAHEKPDEGYINVENTGLGKYRALGILYMINHVNIARERGESAFHFHAASTVGGALWAEAVAEIDWERMDDGEILALTQHISGRQALVKKSVTRDAWRTMGERFKSLDERDPRALWGIIADRTPLVPTAKLGAKKPFRDAARHYGQDNVPYGPFLLLGSRWRGLYRVDDQTQLKGLSDLYRRKRGDPAP